MSHLPNIDLGEDKEGQKSHDERGHSLHPYYYDHFEEPEEPGEVDETEPGGKPFDGTDI